MNEHTVCANDIFKGEDDRIDQLLDADSYNRKNQYNFFGFKPVKEERNHEPVEVVGTLPEDLVGVYLRNGTNPQFDPSFARYHMFDGAGMLHQIQISKGGATYSNTYVRTPRFEFERLAGREMYWGFAEMVSGGAAFLEKKKLVDEKRKNGIIPDFGFDGTQSSTSVQPIAGKIFCLQENGYPFTLHARKEGERLVLDGKGAFETWGGKLKHPFSAHPAIDPETGDVYSVTINYITGDVEACCVHDGDLIQTCTVNAFDPARGKMGWMHECLITENFLVFPDISLRLDEKEVLGPESSAFVFKPEYKLRWGVFPRKFAPGTEVRWFETEHPGAIWHSINAWEERGPDGVHTIVIYAPRFDWYPADIPIHTPAEPPAFLNKWALDLDSGRVSEDRKLLDWGYERTSMNTDYRGKKNRYAYLLDKQRVSYLGKGVLKYDLFEEKEIAYFDYGEFFGGEPLFVPRVGAVEEDDGYLLDLLMADNKAELIVIDARSMQERARLKLPGRVPFGVHGCWLDEETLAGLLTE